MAMFINYQKMRRRIEETTTAFLQRGNISTVINYEYDRTGNPETVKINAGTQTVQLASIKRDRYNITQQIQYIGTINGFVVRDFDQDSYNPVSETMQTQTAFRLIDNSCIDDKLDEDSILNIPVEFEEPKNEEDSPSSSEGENSSSEESSGEG